MPYFSIVIPTYNRAHIIGKAIESVLCQTFSDWELIVVDDGSTDNTKEVVEGYQDERIIYLHQENAERSVARNRGINYSKGKYICFLDSDDRFTSDRLQKLYNSIQEQNEPVAMFFTAIIFENGSQSICHKIYQRGYQESIYDYIVKSTLGTPQVCIHREILMKHQFNPNFRIGEDKELWMRIAKDFPIECLIDQNTVIALEHEDRSINLHKNNVALEHLKMLSHIFEGRHPGANVSCALKRQMLSDCYFNVAKHYMFNKKRAKSIYWILKSLGKAISHPQRRHWLYCLSNLAAGKVPQEYR